MKGESFDMLICITKAKLVSQEPSAEDISFFWTCSKGRIK